MHPQRRRIGVIIGCIVAWSLGHMSFAKVATAPWFAPIYPLQFGVPQFQLVPVVTMCIVIIVVMIETAGASTSQ